MRIIKAFALYTLTLALVVGCGTLFSGTKQDITVNSKPPGATVTVTPTGQTANTPTTLTLKKKYRYTLRFEKEGFKPKEFLISQKMSVGMLVLDVIFGGLIGIIVDSVTGGWYKLTPTDINVTLEKVEVASPDIVSSDVEQGPHRVMNFIAVMDLNCGTAVSEENCAALTNVVIDELVKTKKYTVIDRANRDMIFAEMGFQMTGCVDESCTVEAGRILGVGKIVVGSITKIGQTYLVGLQLVNVETAAVDASANETCKYNLDGLIETVRNVARKLMGEAITINITVERISETDYQLNIVSDVPGVGVKAIPVTSVQ